MPPVKDAETGHALWGTDNYIEPVKNTRTLITNFDCNNHYENNFSGGIEEKIPWGS